MHIVCCTDINYIMPTGIMLKSLSISNKDEDLKVHIIIDHTVSEEDKKALKFNINGNVFFYSTEGIKCDFPNIGVTNKHVTVASYYRLFLSQLLPDNIEKVIYLDGDTIVNDNLSALWNMDISNYALGCVKDMDEIPNLSRVDYAKENGYFNAGVLLINLKYWRKNRLQDVFLNCMSNHREKLIYHDQDVLNFTLYDKKQWLPMRYNVQNGFLFKRKYQLFVQNYEEDDLNTAQQYPAIIHYTLSKPWKKYSMSPFKKNFVRVKRQTQWANVPEQKNPLKGIVLVKDIVVTIQR